MPAKKSKTVIQSPSKRRGSKPTEPLSVQERQMLGNAISQQVVVLQVQLDQTRERLRSLIKIAQYLGQ